MKRCLRPLRGKFNARESDCHANAQQAEMARASHYCWNVAYRSQAIFQRCRSEFSLALVDACTEFSNSLWRSILRAPASAIQPVQAHRVARLMGATTAHYRDTIAPCLAKACRQIIKGLPAEVLDQFAGVDSITLVVNRSVGNERDKLPPRSRGKRPREFID